MAEHTQKLFLALTFIIIVAIIYMSESLPDAMLMISLIAQFLIISTLMASVHSNKPSDHPTVGLSWYPIAQFRSRDQFASRPITPVPPHIQYPGGLDHLFTSRGGANYDFGATGPAGLGAVYTPVDERLQSRWSAGGDGPAIGPYDPYMLNRIESRAGPAACETGYASEAYNSFDADRQMVEHGRWRNDPARAAAVVRNRKAHVQKYVEEELQEKENEPWWGRWDV